MLKAFLKMDRCARCVSFQKLRRIRMLEELRSRCVNRKHREATSLTGLAYRSDASCVRVHVRNISFCGCHLVSDAGFALMDVITLALPHMQEMKAQVRWVKDGQAGVRFLQEGITNPRQMSLGL